MNWLLNLFKKKETDNSGLYKSDEDWDNFINFERGKKYFFSEKWEDALYHFDKAIENGFEKDKIFEFRGICLQSLGNELDAIENFNKAILFSSNDCNLYYTRAISKGAILDYEGEIKDIEKAIELSKQDTPLNRNYNNDAIKIGYSNGILGMYEIALLSVKSRLEFDIRARENEHFDEKDMTFEEKKADLIERFNSKELTRSELLSLTALMNLKKKNKL